MDECTWTLGLLLPLSPTNADHKQLINHPCQQIEKVSVQVAPISALCEYLLLALTSRYNCISRMEIASICVLYHANPVYRFVSNPVNKNP